jgi:hypothetical protein
VASETLGTVHHFVKKPLDLIFLLHKVLLYVPHNKNKKVTAAVPPDAHLPPPQAPPPSRLMHTSHRRKHCLPSSSLHRLPSSRRLALPPLPLASSGLPSAAAQLAGAGHLGPPNPPLQGWTWTLLHQRPAMDPPRCTGCSIGGHSSPTTAMDLHRCSPGTRRRRPGRPDLRVSRTSGSSVASGKGERGVDLGPGPLPCDDGGHVGGDAGVDEGTGRRVTFEKQSRRGRSPAVPRAPPPEAELEVSMVAAAGASRSPLVRKTTAVDMAGALGGGDFIFLCLFCLWEV